MGRVANVSEIAQNINSTIVRSTFTTLDDDPSTTIAAIIASEGDMANFATNSSKLIHPNINCTDNSTLSYTPLEWGWMETVKLLIVTPVVFFAIFGNLLALFAFITRRRQMKSPTHYFIANLALADFLVGVLCLPFLATQTITKRNYFGPSFCFPYMLMHYFFCAGSIYSTVGICVERYIGVRYPLSHTRIMSIPRVMCIIVFIWIYGCVITLTSLFIWPESHTNEDDCPSNYHYDCKSNEQPGHVIFSSIFILYIPATIMVTLYYRIWSLATRHFKLLRKTFKMSQKTGNRHSETFSSALEQDTVVISEIHGDDSNSSNGESNVTTPTRKTAPWFPTMKKKLLMSTIRPSALNEEDKTGNLLIQATNSRKHINLAKRLVFLVGVLLLSYVPYYTVSIIKVMTEDEGQKEVLKNVWNVLKWVRYGNSALNPFIYCFTIPVYRKAFENIICKGKLFS